MAWLAPCQIANARTHMLLRHMQPSPLPQAGTYNVAGKRPPEALRLHSWLDQLSPGSGNAGGSAGVDGGLGPGGADIIVAGFQVGPRAGL